MAKTASKAGGKTGGKTRKKAAAAARKPKAAAKPKRALAEAPGFVVPLLAEPFALPVGEDEARAAVLGRLWSVVMQRRGADQAISHSARLLARGVGKVAQKFGEESVECLIEAVAGNSQALIAESADVLYHLIVLWVACGITPVEVWSELERREGVSGVAEKAARGLLPRAGTTKIP